MPVIRRIIGLGSIFLVGAILGPVLLAVSSSLGRSDDLMAKFDELRLLLDTYRAHLPKHQLFLTLVGPEGETECGYERETVFPSTMEGLFTSQGRPEWSYRAGYEVLDRWRGDAEDENYVWAIGGKILDDMTTFEMSFYRKCIASTVFSSLCMRQIAAYSEGIDRTSARKLDGLLGSGFEQNIVCTYIDGAAARQGIPLVNPSN